MSVFDVVIKVKKINSHNLEVIKEIVYSNLENDKKAEYKQLENYISKKLTYDVQYEITCNLLLYTFILKMYMSLRNDDYLDIINSYDLMIDFLKYKYELKNAKQKIFY